MSDGDHSAKPNGGWPPSPRLAFAECLALPRARHSAKGGFAECYPLPSAWHSAKKDMPSVWLCRVRHSAKSIFAECPTFGTRQSRKHSAKPLFPIVGSGYSNPRDFMCSDFACQQMEQACTKLYIADFIPGQANKVFIMWYVVRQPECPPTPLLCKSCIT